MAILGSVLYPNSLVKPHTCLYLKTRDAKLKRLVVVLVPFSLASVVYKTHFSAPSLIKGIIPLKICNDLKGENGI